MTLFISKEFEILQYRPEIFCALAPRQSVRNFQLFSLLSQVLHQRNFPEVDIGKQCMER